MEANETPRTSLSVAEESHKEQDDLKDAKNVKGGSRSSSAEKSRENGVRVSENGGEGGELRDGVADTRGLKTSGDEKVGSLDDDAEAEMNGVSSLLQIRQSGNLKGLGPVMDAIDKNEDRVPDVRDGGYEYPDGKIGEDGEGNKEGDEEGHEFKVGDFVWGKIRSHPWWPGRVYDPMDASNYAMKVKPRDRLLVAYFGDRTFAWCSPSQLKPFAENFMEMSGSSSSKNFLNAVEEAVDEVGRLVELEMTCSCVPEENLIGLGRSLAHNAGIKEGVLMPEGGIEKFSIAFFESLYFLDAMKCIASIATVSNMLELGVFKSWLSAFYRAKGGYQLPSYYDPQPIPGLEEGNGNLVGDFNGANGGKEVRFGGPVEEDWFSSREGSKFDQPSESLLQKCQGGRDDKLRQRIKQKSIAEIMEKHDNAELNKDSKSKKPAYSTKSKKRKDRDGTSGEGLEVKDKNEVGNIDKEKATKSESRRKKRKGHDEADVDVKEKIIDVAKAGVASNKSAGNKKRKKLKSTDEPAGGNDSTPKPRTRKASKLGKSVAAENPVSSNEIDGNVVNKESSKRGRKKKQVSVAENDGGESKKEKTGKNMESAEKKMDVTGSIQSDDGEEQNEKGFSPRERKRSKYLSPPYTNLNRGQRKAELETESPKASGEVSSERPKTEAASSSVSVHSPNAKSGDEKTQKKASEEPRTANGKSPKSRPPPLKINQNNIVDPVKVKTPSSEVLRSIRSAALSPLSLDKSNPLDVVEDFFSAFRNSTYTDGSNQKSKPGRKRKAEESEPRPLVKGQKQTDHSSPEHKSRRTKVDKSEVSKQGRPKSSQAATAADTKTNSKKSVKKASRRGPAAKVQDQNEPDGKTPRTKVKKTREIGELSGFKASSRSKDGAKTHDKQSAAGNVSQLSYIKQKLEKMSSMLETSDGKISPTMKSKLEGEMKGLLEEMNTMISSSP